MDLKSGLNTLPSLPPSQTTGLSQPCLQDCAEKGTEWGGIENKGVLPSPLWGHFTSSPQMEHSQL